MKTTFTVEAKKYFEVDAETLERVQPGDLVLVELDRKTRTANYTWYGADENPANFPSVEDDYDGVVEALVGIGEITR